MKIDLDEMLDQRRNGWRRATFTRAEKTVWVNEDKGLTIHTVFALRLPLLKWPFKRFFDDPMSRRQNQPVILTPIRDRLEDMSMAPTEAMAKDLCQLNDVPDPPPHWVGTRATNWWKKKWADMVPEPEPEYHGFDHPTEDDWIFERPDPLKSIRISHVDVSPWWSSANRCPEMPELDDK